MELEQILREIRDSQVYTTLNWQEYLACFSDSSQMDLGPSPRTDKAYGEIARRIGLGEASICETLSWVSSKVVTPDFIQEEKKRNQMTLGIVSGCFDLLHLGHVKGMQYAKDFLSQFWNGKLCVLCLSDRYIRIKKGQGRPVLNLNERLGMISGVRYVDYVVLLDAPDCLKTLELLKPDWYFKSEADLDRSIVRREADRVHEQGGHVHGFPKSVSNITSTTEIIQKMRSQLCTAENL